MNEQENNNKIELNQTDVQKKRWFGRGIYGSKDVPIRILDGAIAVLILLALVLIVYFAINGGYTVSFDTDGGTEIVSQKLRHGTYVEEPDIPLKPGYTFLGWYTGEDLERKWVFSVDTVQESTKLTAKWAPAQICVKFDLNGGTVDGQSEIPEVYVTYGQPYGTLPTPVRQGAVFDGWLYSGQTIHEDTVVFMTGEHVLTAQWK